MQMARHSQLLGCHASRLHTSFSWSGERAMSGFVVDPEELTRHFAVELLIDGLPVKTALAQDYVHELAQRGIGNGCYGFTFPLADEFVNEGAIVEARIANVGTPVGRPIVLGAQADSDADFQPGPSPDACLGAVRWLGGLRFTGWLPGDALEGRLDVRVDGELVTQAEISGWSHVGTDPEQARAVRAFAFHLPEQFADGLAHQLAVTKPNADPLPGCPMPFVAFADGLAGTLARLGEAESESLRAEQFDRLVPMSVPFSHYRAWRDRFRPRPAYQPRQQGAVVMVGDSGVEATLASLEAQTPARWIAASLPDGGRALSFDPLATGAFLENEGEACDFVVFAVAGAIFAPDALARLASAFGEFRHACAIYGDVEIIGDNNAIWPLAFPSFDYERLLEQGYGAHLFALPRAIARAALAAGAADLYRLFNSVVDCEANSANVVHLPGALGALPPIDPTAAQPVLLRATRSHLAARGIDATVTAARGGIMPAVRVSRAADHGKTTIIIPTRNRRELLADCIESVKPAARKCGAEIIVVDNDSTACDALAYLDAIDGKVARVLRVAGAFNFARLNNLAAAAATGENLCLLNNDIKALDDQWLGEMLSRLAGQDVGAVGALLLWPSGIVQHGGVVLGTGFAATHAFNDRMGEDPGYGDLMRVAHQCSAVTAACLLTRRATFLAVGGLDEHRFPVNFNDVDYCLKLRAARQRIVFTPHARLLHLESASRGQDKTPDRRARFARELVNLRTKWGTALIEDSYYNPTLSLDPIPFSALAWPPRDMTARLPAPPTPVIAPPGM
jgi:GT2 family glycosyltransferase